MNQCEVPIISTQPQMHPRRSLIRVVFYLLNKCRCFIRICFYLLRRFRIPMLVACLTLFFGEFLIYYVVLAGSCSWPATVRQDSDGISHQPDSDAVKALILSDTHLLGIRRGHWADRLRREWQMERTFQTSLTLFNPDVIFVLGDLFDEGDWAGREEIEIYAQRFRRIFNTHGKPLHAAVGNHDIGFHYAITERKLRWFYETFHIDTTKMLNIRGVIFILLNSMTFEGDHCRLCTEAERQLTELNRTLSCIKKNKTDHTACPGISHLNTPPYVKPVLLQHFPLYRYSDAICNEPDEAPADTKRVKFKPLWDCLSEEASDLIISKLQPRAVFSGHSHFGCELKHDNDALTEHTVGSFSCRNTKNPAFLLATFTPTGYAISKCLTVREDSVYWIYGVVFILLPLALLVHFCYRRCTERFTRKRL